MRLFKTTKYYRIGLRPVKTIRHRDGSFGVYALNWKTGKVELNMAYLTHVMEGADNLDEIDYWEFKRLVAHHRKERGL